MPRRIRDKETLRKEAIMRAIREDRYRLLEARLHAEWRARKTAINSLEDVLPATPRRRRQTG